MQRHPPPVGDAGAPRKRHRPVDDEQLAVAAVVQTAQAVPHEPLVGGDAAAGGLQRCRQLANGSEAADGVHHDRHAHAGARPLAERLDEAIADRPVLEDVALQRHGFTRLPDRVEHRRIEAIAVGENLDAVAAFELRLTGGLEHVHAVVAARIDRRLDVIRDVRHEQHREDQPGDEDAADDREVEHG